MEGVTDAQTFNQDTNLEAKFATGISSATKFWAGLITRISEAGQGTASVDDNGGFNVYNPVYGQGAWEWTDCKKVNQTGSSPPNLEICSFAGEEVTQTGLYIQDQIEARKLDRSPRYAQGLGRERIRRGR